MARYNDVALAVSHGTWYLIMAYRKPHWAEQMLIQGPHKTKELALAYWKEFYQEANFLVAVQNFDPIVE